MVYCPGCGTANRDGSRFCNECGTKLPTMTSSLCPTCGTPNPPHSLFCEKCGTRLIASLAEEPEEPETSAPSTFVPKGLSLPTKSVAGAEPVTPPTSSELKKSAEPVTPTKEEMPDWMQFVQSTTDASESDTTKATTAGGTADQSPTEEVPDWLSNLGPADQSAATKKPGTDELLPEWAQRLRTMPEATQPPASEEEVPDWLKTLGATGQLPAAEETPAVPIPAAEEELPEWLKEPATPYFSTEPEPPTPPPPAPQAKPASEEMPDWLRDLRPAAGSEEALPDWLDELGGEEQPASESTALSTGDSALDWLSQLSATAPEAPSTQTAEPADWMSSFRAASLEPEAPAEEEGMPDWMKGAGLAAGAAAVGGIKEEQPSEPAASMKPVTDWLSALRQATPETETGQSTTEEIPDWMSVVGAEETPSGAQTEEGIPDWLKGAGLAAAGAAAVGGTKEEQPSEPVAPEKPVTDWLSTLRRAAPEMESEQAAAEEIPDWMSVVGAEETPPTAQTEEGIPDWLKGAGLAAAGAAAIGKSEEEPPSESVAPEKPVTDWLSALRQATPEIEAEQAGAEEIPDWMREETEIAPQAMGGPQTSEQEIPDWLRESGTSYESTEEQPAGQAEKDVPDWMRGFGAVAAGEAIASAEEEQPQEVTPQKAASDWLSALREATPEIEAEQATAEEVPEWMREETAVSPQAIGGPQAYEQEVPDWLRETGAVATPESSQVEEANIPDWLREETGATTETTQAPAATQAEEEAGVPDWLKGLGGAAAVGAAAATAREQELADEGLPDWLRQEAAPAAQPSSALTFEEQPPQAEEAEPGETPDWLRELTPAEPAAALVPAEPEVEEPEEIEQPEEAAEAESETEGGVLAAAALAAGVAGAARRLEKEESAPAEMPEWLKEIRREQEVTQQAARRAIPVPPPEATGLTQAEIPAWLEALRPTEEAEAPKEAEAPLEVEGPLAGIANALPPAPIMGEIQGPAVKLQFAVSAEDQARAGILKELLTQHAVAPAAVEQFVVKGSVIRRRALRWVVAFLLILALLVPIGNELKGILPMAQAASMVVPPAVRSAAFQISQLAQLQPNSKVLVVFDYDATQAGELNRVAQALLQSPALRNAQIETASLNPQGSIVAQTVMKGLPDLQYTDLGFVPGQVNGVQALLAQAGDAKLIIELAASPETVRWWVEQMTANRFETPLVAGVSAGAEPLTMPYLQSGQVKGLVSGFPGAVAYLNATGMTNTYSEVQLKKYQIPLDGLTLANYVMVVLIAVSGIGALLRGSGRRPT